MKNQFNYYLILLIFFSSNYFSNIWINSDKEFDIQKIEYYSSLNNINVNTTSYPISINQMRSSKNYGSITIGKLIEFKSLLNKKFEKEEKYFIKLSSFSDTSPIRNIDDNWKSKNTFSIETNFTLKNFSTNVYHN